MDNLGAYDMRRLAFVTILASGCTPADDGKDTPSSDDSAVDGDADTDGDADSDADADTDGDADGDADADGDTDADSDADSDADADGDSDTDTDTDTTAVPDLYIEWVADGVAGSMECLATDAGFSARWSRGAYYSIACNDGTYRFEVTPSADDPAVGACDMAEAWCGYVALSWSGGPVGACFEAEALSGSLQVDAWEESTLAITGSLEGTWPSWEIGGDDGDPTYCPEIEIVATFDTTLTEI